MTEEKLGYSKTARALFWASFKALLIVSILSTLEMGYIFSQAKWSEGVIDSFLGALLMHILSIVLFLPFIWILMLLIGAPVVLWLFRKRWWHHYILIAFGAAISVILFKSFFIMGHTDSVSLKTLLSGNTYFLLGGGLTGFFVFRQLQKKQGF
jgi:hypothetical protein